MGVSQGRPHWLDRLRLGVAGRPPGLGPGPPVEPKHRVDVASEDVTPIRAGDDLREGRFPLTSGTISERLSESVGWSEIRTWFAIRQSPRR